MENERAAVALLDKPDISPESPSSFEVVDEFNNVSETYEPLPGYSFYQPQFDYYARTRLLEANSPRTVILQGITDKMTAGTDVTARVVIMNKGEDTQGFVAADGTIFISQSLINDLGSLDEVAGVLAHEAGHRINKTQEKKSSRQPEFAVGWIHEVASDNLAPHLLEKAGFNSFGLARAIAKIAANQRDSEHQTGEARATQVTLQHGGIHFATSDQEFTPIPQILKTAQITPTNIEIINKILADLGVEKWGRTIPRLHPADLGTAYAALAGQPREYNPDKKQAQEDMLEKAINLMWSRLKSSGLTKEFVDLYFLSSQGSDVGYRRTFSMIQTPEELTAAVNELDSFIEQDHLNKSQHTLFGKSIRDHYGPTILTTILDNLADHLCDLSKSPNQQAIPVTQNSLVAVLQKIHEVNKIRKIIGSDSEITLMSRVAGAYITNAYLSAQPGEDIDSKALHQFFLELKEAGIPVNQKDLTNNYSYKWSVSTTAKVIAVYQEVFPVEKETDLESVTGQFLQRLAEAENFDEQRMALEVFLVKSRKLMDKAKTSDGERKLFLDELHDKLGQITLIIPPDIAKSLHLGQWGEMQTRAIEGNVYRFNLDLAMALGIFQQDGNEFYDYITGSISRNSFNPDTLTWFGLANTIVNLLRAPSSSRIVFFSGNAFNDPDLALGDTASVTDIQRLLSLPLLQYLIKRQPQVNFATLKEFNEYVRRTFSGNLRFYEIGQIYDDSLPALILGQHLRHNAQDLFRSGIKETEYDALFEFIINCIPNGQERNRVLRSIKRHFLRSREVDLDQKTDYLIRNFDDIGPEGMIEVAEQITTLSDYRKFHGRLFEKIESYLNGSLRVTELAAIDDISSRFIGQFNSLLLTAKTDSQSRRKSSTDLARVWHDYAFKYGPGVDYDPKLKKIILGSVQRQAFQTFGDLIDNLQHLTPLQRFAIALKAMVDKNGAMTSQDNRRLLGETITDALKINSTFINSAIRIACLEVPADFGSLPASQILAPLLFKNLDSDWVEKDFFEEYVSEGLKGEIKRLMKASTRDVTLFGIKYLHQPYSYAAKTVSESDGQYREVATYLTKLFPAGEVGEDISKSEIDPSLEAVISGVENSGPLGTRGLQLTRQLVEFSPPVDRRLARSLDRMRGLNKLLFWENILKLIDDARAGRLNGGTNQRELIDFFEHRLVSLDDYLGGGSLYTTYGALILNDQGERVNAVVKMLRPNPEVFIKTAYKTTSEVFTEIEKSRSEKDRQYARMGQLFIDLAQNWCLNDILDPSFVEDDDGFRTVIDDYNARAGRITFYAPERMMTSYHVKSETMAEGQTLNQLLEDKSVKPAVKKRAVGLVVDLFRHQLRKAVTRTVEGQTENFHLVHSDPHVGNYIVDINGGNLKIGVVDRSMYLKLTPQQARTFDKLLSNGDYRGFVSSLIDAVMDYNKVISDTVRKTTKNNILGALTREYLAQKLHSLTKLRLDVDNFALLRKMLDGFDRAKLDIPLEIRLMIKNVESLRELQRRY